ncbi:uncharacterized protein LOC126826758 [Patella vulgata]|uniref:uncharacterized protein LOC126826758 n=1 Tax=Patella vulgata TaxID=6465 RepID=UPI00217FA31E|nr:uncharacterized protein LOC126826758 [Patella vulgata]XP_050411801.1 uncharacterized protein LOC126826758 [Patella vulgata]XP_055958494.1 uncharacterized protein LOC126826758 [Patella vulgata]
MCLSVTGVIGLVLTTMLLHVPLSDCQNCDANKDAVPVCSGLTKSGRFAYLSGIEDGDNTTECFCSFSIDNSNVDNDLGDVAINNVTIPSTNCDFYLASKYKDATGTLYSCQDNTNLKSYTLNPSETVEIGIAKISNNGNGFKFCLEFESSRGSSVQLNCETFISFLIPPTTTKATTTTLFPPSTSAGSTAATSTSTTLDETTAATTIAATTESADQTTAATTIAATTGSADQTTAATTITATTGSADQTTGSTSNVNGGGDETTTSSNNNGGETTSSSNNGGGGTTSSNNNGGGETTANNNNGEDPDTELGIIIGFVVVLIILIIIIIIVAIFYMKRKNSRRNRVDITPPTPKTPKK